MSVLRTFHRQQHLLKCRAQTQYNGITQITIRGIQNSAVDAQPAGGPFRILFLGRDEFSCIVLEELHKAKDVWEELIIATHPDTYVGRAHSVLSVSPLKTLAAQLSLPAHPIPETRFDFRKWKLPRPFEPLHKYNGVPPLNHLLITASFGRILTPMQLKLFNPARRLNLHPSLLPAYRGPAPIQHAILNDEKVTGVCVIEMLRKRQGIDAGGIWASSQMPVPTNAYFTDLRTSLAIEGGKLLVSVLRDMMADKVAPVPQASPKDLPFAALITPEDALIDFSTMTAESIRRRHRAFSHQEPLFTHVAASSLQLHDLTTTTDVPPDLPTEPGSAKFIKATQSLIVRCSDGSAINVNQVKPQGKRLMPVKEWWNGLRQAQKGFIVLGADQEAESPVPEEPVDTSKSIDGLPDDGLPGDGLPGDGLPGDGLPVDGLPVDGLPDDGLPGDGLPGDGLTPGDNPAPPASQVLT